MADRTPRFGRGSQRAVALAIAIGTVGCAGPDKNKPPFEMTQDLQSKLAAPVSKNTAPLPTASFDPAATGGQGVTTQNSFGRLKPGAGTSTPGNFVATLPAPQIGGAATVSAPVQPGMAHVAAAPLVPESSRMTTPGRAPITPIQQTGGMTPATPSKLEPVMSEPPMTHATASQPLPPVSPTTPNLSTPIADPEPLPRPVPPQPPVGAAPLLPVTSGNDGPGSGTLAPLPSATDGPPINGIKPPAPLKPADPVRPF